MIDLGEMTLKRWVELGNPMFSNYTMAALCHALKVNPKQLIENRMVDIFGNPEVGEVARREVERWLSAH
jgi:hypothetical protein